MSLSLEIIPNKRSIDILWFSLSVAFSTNTVFLGAFNIFNHSDRHLKAYQSQYDEKFVHFHDLFNKKWLKCNKLYKNIAPTTLQHKKNEKVSSYCAATKHINVLINCSAMHLLDFFPFKLLRNKNKSLKYNQCYLKSLNVALRNHY